MSLTESRQTLRVLIVLYALISTVFAIKCFIESIIIIEVPGIIGSIFVLLFQCATMWTSIRMEKNKILISLSLVVSLIYFVLTLISFIAGFFIYLNFGLSEYKVMYEIVCMIIYLFEAFLLLQFYLDSSTE